MYTIQARLRGTKNGADDLQPHFKPPHVIPGVGHMSLVAKPDAVNSLIDTFLVQLK